MATEKRLIDADEVLDVICNYCPDDVHCPVGGCAEFQKISGLLTADSVEVVHGRWKYYHKQNIAVCTNCSFERDLDANFGRAISCPNCGAKMDGDGNG